MSTAAFRTSFSYNRVINWFPGHMVKGIKDIENTLNAVDLVVEARDARIPISSINPKFEALIKDKDRMILYNKADLADSSAIARIQKAFAKHDESRVYFSTVLNNKSKTVEGIIKYAAEKAQSNTAMFPSVTVMVVGMPNVGKSSLINAMRNVGMGKRKTLKTGREPGVTRNMHQKVKVFENPAVYLIDTPGVMIPYISDPLVSLKVALTGGIRDHIADVEIMSDYLLFVLNQRANRTYLPRYHLSEPVDDIKQLLISVAKRIGAIEKGGLLDMETAARFFLKDYRDGKFGAFSLDDVTEQGLEKYFTSSKDRLPLQIQNAFDVESQTGPEGEEGLMLSTDMASILDANGNRVYSKTQEKKLKRVEQARKRATKFRAHFGDR